MQAHIALCLKGIACIYDELSVKDHVQFVCVSLNNKVAFVQP